MRRYFWNVPLIIDVRKNHFKFAVRYIFTKNTNKGLNSGTGMSQIKEMYKDRHRIVRVITLQSLFIRMSIGLIIVYQLR